MINLFKYIYKNFFAYVGKLIDRYNTFPYRLGFVGFFFVLYVLWLRLFKPRGSISLEQFTFNPIIGFVIILLVLHILMRLYIIFFADYITDKKTSILNIIIDRISIKFINKIENHPNGQSILIAIKIGVYDYLMIHLAKLLESMRVYPFMEKFYDYLIFFHKVTADTIWELVETQSSRWTAIIVKYEYIMFKFAPILFVQVFGLIEICYSNKLYIYYKLLVILLIPFLTNIIYRCVCYINAEKSAMLSREYKIFTQVSMGTKGEPKEKSHIFNLTGFSTDVLPEHNPCYPIGIKPTITALYQYILQRLFEQILHTTFI